MNKFIVLPYDRYQTLCKDKNEEAKKEQKDERKLQLVQHKEIVPEDEHVLQLVQQKDAPPNKKGLQLVDQPGLGGTISPPPPPPKYRLKPYTKPLKKKSVPYGKRKEQWIVF